MMRPVVTATTGKKLSIPDIALFLFSLTTLPISQTGAFLCQPSHRQLFFHHHHYKQQHWKLSSRRQVLPLFSSTKNIIADTSESVNEKGGGGGGNGNTSSSTTIKKQKWFPRRIQEDVEYEKVVQSFYLRHIVVEQMDVAQLAMEYYLNSTSLSSYVNVMDGRVSTEDTTTGTGTTRDATVEETSRAVVVDPFGEIASKISACEATRNDGGKIGWVDLIHNNKVTESGKIIGYDAAPYSTILPEDVFQQLKEMAPKSGDVHIISSKMTGQVHVIRVEELLIQHQANLFPSSTSSSDHQDSQSTNIDEKNYYTDDNGKEDNESIRVGTHSGINAILPRKKLKGKGVMPRFPNLFENTNNGHDDDDDDDEITVTNRRNKENLLYHIQTNGCQMNVADSERLAGILQNDLQLQPSMKGGTDANVILINTCSIRDHAEQKLYDILGPYRARKRDGEELAIIVTGCVAQQEGQLLLRKIPEIDVVLGPQYVPFLQNVLESVQWGHQVVVTAPMLHKEDNDFTKPIRGHTVRAWVNIINGCNEHCTYCVVPATRGMEQSRSMESILQECLSLVRDNGYREITLLGQNIDAYGRDMAPKRTFAELLGFLNSNLPSQTRIRYVTSHPRYFSDRVIDAVANLDKVCECFHMPFQAGDDDVLKRMRRGYTFDSYLKIIDKIRVQAPDAAICGDVIVGFPGETEDAFQRTLDLMERVKFDNLNTFAYSPRPNTEAALWDDQISEDIKNERLKRVQELAVRHGLERSQRYLNRIVEVLVEDTNPRNSNQVMGRTRQGRQVYFDGDAEVLKGQFVNVKITEARTWSLMGEMMMDDVVVTP